MTGLVQQWHTMNHDVMLMHVAVSTASFRLLSSAMYIDLSQSYRA